MNLSTSTGKQEKEVNIIKILINVFSREKSLIYFCLWDASDRKGTEIAGNKIKNNLFIVPPAGQQGSVWYEAEELRTLKEKLLEKLRDHQDNQIWIKIKRLTEKSWEYIKPYALGSAIK